MATTPLSPSFASWGEHGGGGLKSRVVDDLKAPNVNDYLGLVDTSIPGDLDVFLSMLLMHAQLCPGRKLLAYTSDFDHAYMHVGVAADQLDFPTAILRGPEGFLHMSTLKTHPFGRRRALDNWERVASFLQFPMDKLLDLWLGICVDDCVCVEPESTIRPAMSAIKAICKLLGLMLHDRKDEPPCQSLLFLGAQITVSEGGHGGTPGAQTERLHRLHAQLPGQRNDVVRCGGED